MLNICVQFYACSMSTILVSRKIQCRKLPLTIDWIHQMSALPFLPHSHVQTIWKDSSTVLYSSLPLYILWTQQCSCDSSVVSWLVTYNVSLVKGLPCVCYPYLWTYPTLLPLGSAMVKHWNFSKHGWGSLNGNDPHELIHFNVWYPIGGAENDSEM